MPLMIDAKIKPSGSFPAVDAEDILMPSGKRLTEEAFGAAAQVDFIPEQTVEFLAMSENLYVWSQAGAFTPLIPGEVYQVVFGEFGGYTDMIAFSCVFNGADAVALGCGAIIGMEADPEVPQEPFLFGVLADGSECAFFTPVSGDSRTVRVYQVHTPVLLPETTEVHEGKLLQVVDGKIVYSDSANMKVGGVTLDTYIGNAINDYIEEALGGDY